MSNGPARTVNYFQGTPEVAGDPRRVFGVVAYQFTATATGAVVANIVAPAADLVGRVVGVSTVVTTGVTDAPDVLQIGDGTDADEFGTHTVAIGAAGTKNYGVTPGDDALIAAGERVVLTNTGAQTAGVYSGAILIEWFDPAL